jgi:hypothetical protein
MKFTPWPADDPNGVKSFRPKGRDSMVQTSISGSKQEWHRLATVDVGASPGQVQQLLQAVPDVSTENTTFHTIGGRNGFLTRPFKGVALLVSPCRNDKQAVVQVVGDVDGPERGITASEICGSLKEVARVSKVSYTPRVMV